MAERGRFSRFADGVVSLLGFGDRRGREQTALARPELRERAYSSPVNTGFMDGPWRRWLDAKWLGPYTPTLVPMWIRKIMRRDPQIRLGLTALKSPLFGIEYRVTGGSPASRAFTNKVLLERRELFTRLLTTILLAVDFGFSTHEILWELADVTFDEEGPGGIPPTTLLRANVIREFSELDPERVALLLGAHRRMLGVQFGGIEGERIPIEKLLHAVHQLEFRNWLGETPLDGAYPFWYNNNLNYLFLSRYLEQKGNPPLVARAPAEARYDESLPRDNQIPVFCMDKLGEAVASLRGGGVAQIPDERDAQGNQRWAIDILEDGGRTEQFLPVVQHNESMKLRSVLVPEKIATQDTAVGSYAASDVMLEVFFHFVEGLKQHLVIPAINEAIRKLVRANFSSSEPVPTLEGADLARESKQLLASIVTGVLSLPRTTPDGFSYTLAEIVDDVRILEALNVPHKRPSDVARAKAKSAPAPAGAPPTNPGPAGPKLGELAKRLGMSPQDLLEQLALASRGPEGVEAVRAKLESLARSDRRELAAVNVVSVPPAEVTINVPQQPAPIVHVEAAKPIVIPAPKVETFVDVQPSPPTPVHVENVIERSSEPLTLRIERDRDGKLSGADIRLKE